MFEDALIWATAAPRAIRDHLASAVQLVPALAARADETTRARRLLDANVADVTAAGILKTIQPRRCGGHEYGLHAYLDVVDAIAHGCGSTGWVVSLYQAHSWVIGLFEEQAQDEVYGSPDARIAAVVAPRGRARKTDGGYLLSGSWPFCSGCHHAHWLLLGGVLVDHEDEPGDWGVMLVPARDAEIRDDWHVGGLAGTGSNSVAVQDVFVPAHRFLSVAGAIDGHAPGAGLHASTLYSSALMPVLALSVAAPALGMARRALEHFKERLPGRTVSYTFNERQIDMPATHMAIAESTTKFDAARTLLHASVDAIELHARSREVMPFEARAKARMDIAYAARLCLEATQSLYLASGGSGLAEAGPIHQAQRDLHALNMHGLLSLQTNLEMYGRVLLGLRPNSPFI